MFPRIISQRDTSPEMTNQALAEALQNHVNFLDRITAKEGDMIITLAPRAKAALKRKEATER